MADNGGESQVVGVGDTIQISFGHNEANYTFSIAGAGTVNVTVSVRQRHHLQQLLITRLQRLMPMPI